MSDKKKEEVCKTCMGRREVIRAYGQRFPCPSCNVSDETPSQEGLLPAPAPYPEASTTSGG
jgi:hypothetical protein